MTSLSLGGRGRCAQRIPPPPVLSCPIAMVTRLLGLLVGVVMLQGCVPTLAAPDWQLPVRLGGQIYAVPVPVGMVETCAGDRSEYAVRSGTLAASSRLVACVETPGDDSNALAGLITTAISGDDADAEFAQYKQALVAQAQASAAEAAGQRRLAGRSRVVRVLRQGKRWTLHAVYVGQRDGTGRTGVISTALIRDRLFYLSLLTDAEQSVNWPELTERSEAWARALLSKNLVPVLASPGS